jgi:hypothetical protein
MHTKVKKPVNRLCGGFVPSARSVLLVAISSIAGQVPCLAGYEYGDVHYRDNGFPVWDEWGHCGIASGVDGSGTPTVIEVSQEIGSGWILASIDYDTVESFTNGVYWGAFQRGSSPSFEKRRDVVQIARDFESGYSYIYYCGYPPLFDMINAIGSGSVDMYEITGLRCDGLVEYAYEVNGLAVWGKNCQHYDVSDNFSWMAEHNNWYDWPFNTATETAPVVQCGREGGDGYGDDCTYLDYAATSAPPTVTVWAESGDGSSAQLHITASDTKSGIHEILVRRPNGSIYFYENQQHPTDTDWSKNFTATESGTYKVWATDNANNECSQVSIYVDLSCSTPNPGSPSASPSSGCDPLSVTVSGSGGTQYDWQYQRPSSGSWYNFGGSSSSATKTCDSPGTWRFRYKRRNGNCDWSGWGSSRSVSVQDCSDPEGACCIGYDCYSSMTEDECDDYWDSQWLGAGSSCSGDPCGSPDPVGACCVGTSCDVVTQADCSGSWQGAGTTCSGNPCGGGGGSCPGGEIEDCNGNCCPANWVNDGYCDDGAYSWNGVAIYLNCDEFGCDGGDCTDCGGGEPTGACCIGTSCSSNVTESACSGTWLGEGSSCSGNPCNVAGNTCSTALQASVGDNAFDTSPPMSDSGFGNPDASQCAGTYLDWQNSPDQWFRWTAPSDGLLTLTTCDTDSYDTSLVLYEGSSCSSLDQIACNGDDGSGGACQPYYSFIANVPVTEGSVYWIRIGGWHADYGSGTLGITLDGSGGSSDPADVNDDGHVDVVDLLFVIEDWCNSCQSTADVDGDGDVDVVDLLLVLIAW